MNLKTRSGFFLTDEQQKEYDQLVCALDTASEESDEAFFSAVAALDEFREKHNLFY